MIHKTKPFIQVLFGFLALSNASIAAPLSAREWRFDIHVAGIRFGEMTVSETRDGPAYRVDAQAEAQGFLGLLIRSRYDGYATGRGKGGAMRVQHFHARSRRIFKDRRTDIAYLSGVPVTVSITPESEKTDWSDPARVTKARVDPLSYLPLMLAPGPGACPATVPLYDGRRQTRVSFAAPVATGGQVTCTGTYEITDGPEHSIQSGRSFPLEITYSGDGNPLSITVSSDGTSVVLTAAR